MKYLPLADLQPGMKIARSIIGRKKSFMLAKGNILTPEFIEHLRVGGYSGAYISDAFTEDVEAEPAISDETFQEGIEAIAEANIGEIVTVSSTMVDEICSRENVFPDMFDLRTFDDYTYHHSVSVAIYAVTVGKAMGLSQEDLNLLGLAGLCHDLGKEKIPKEVLNKPGKLTDEEFNVIKAHPKAGYDLLYDKSEIPAVVRQAVICHHENENGTGYPNGLSGDKIPLFAKIIHVVDVYDALTSRRVYKEPNTPVDALDYLMGGCDTLFDKDVVAAALDVLPSYPPGIEIWLSNGESGIVISHTTNSLRPRVKLYESNRIVDLDNDKEYFTVNIVKSGYLTQTAEKVEQLNENRTGRSDRRKKILYVSDRMIESRQMRNTLEEDFDFDLVNSGSAVIEYIRSKPRPDLLIIDLDIGGGISGLAILRTLRRDGYGPEDLTVMFVGSAKDKETIIKCQALKAVDYILKPINPMYVRTRVEIVLNKNFLFA